MTKNEKIERIKKLDIEGKDALIKMIEADEFDPAPSDISVLEGKRPKFVYP